MPLGVLPYNEIEYGDMMKTMENVQGYLPFMKITRELEVPNPGGQISALKMENHQFVTTLIGGDHPTG